MESGSHKKPVSESSSRRKSASSRSSFAAYLVTKQFLDKKIGELAGRKIGPVDMESLRRSMDNMIHDAACTILQKHGDMLLLGSLPGQRVEETEEEEDLDPHGNVMCDELSRLMVQFLYTLSGEDSFSLEMRWKSMSDTISSYIRMEEEEIKQEAVLLEGRLATVTTGRALAGKEIEGEAVLAEGRLATVTTGRALEGKEIEGDAVLAERRLATVTTGRALEGKEIEVDAVLAERRLATVTTGRALEGKEIEGDAVLAEGRLATVTTGRALEGKEIEGEAVISKDTAAEMEEPFAQARDIMSEPWRKAFEGQAAVAGRSLGTVTMDRGLEGKETEGEAVISKDKAAEIEEEAFALFRRGWEHVNGANNFEDLTLFSPMLFTHSTPGFKPIDAVLARTVQICSIKVTDVEHFKWPLHVYGVVAARDAVDSHRNPIFLRPRDDCQIIYDVDPFLQLTGPVRAIVSEERVDIEIQLIVKGTTASEDRSLISYPFLYDGDYLDGSGISIIEKNFCTLEMCYQQLESSVQATIFGVHADDGKSLPFQYGVRVACTSLSPCGIEEANESASTEVVLLDWKVGRKLAVKSGYLDLARQVVSVELEGKLKVHIETYTSSGDIAAQGDVFVTPKECNTSEHACDLGSFKVNFTVAWSLLVEDEEHILMNGCIDPLAFCPPIGPSTMLS